MKFYLIYLLLPGSDSFSVIGVVVYKSMLVFLFLRILQLIFQQAEQVSEQSPCPMIFRIVHSGN